jgi:hypothetical protein
MERGLYKSVKDNVTCETCNEQEKVCYNDK